jgi:N-methylhydantoinase A
VALWRDEIPVFDRAHLALGQEIAGPAIIEERETTIVLPPAWSATVDALGCVVAERVTA